MNQCEVCGELCSQLHELALDPSTGAILEWDSLTVDGSLAICDDCKSTYDAADTFNQEPRCHTCGEALPEDWEGPHICDECEEEYDFVECSACGETIAIMSDDGSVNCPRCGKVYEGD